MVFAKKKEGNLYMKLSLFAMLASLSSHLPRGFVCECVGLSLDQFHFFMFIFMTLSFSPMEVKDKGGKEEKWQTEKIRVDGHGCWGFSMCWRGVLKNTRNKESKRHVQGETGTSGP